MKTVFTRLVVTFVSLLVAVLALAGALVRLVVTLVTGLTNALERKLAQRTPPEAVRALRGPEARANLKLVPAQPGQTERLTAALRGMGFRAPDVTRFVDGLGPRVETMPLPDLIKEGLRALAA